MNISALSRPAKANVFISLLIQSGDKKKKKQEKPQLPGAVSKAQRKTILTNDELRPKVKGNPFFFFWFGLLTHRFHPMQNFREKIKDVSFKGLKK